MHKACDFSRLAALRFGMSRLGRLNTGAALVLALGLGAALPGRAVAAVPGVVTDIAPVHALVAQVMEGVGTPVLLLDQGADAHHFQLRPSQARALQGADLVVWIGPEMTPWLATALEGIGPKAQRLGLLAAEGTARRAFGEGGDHAHSQGHADHDHDHAGHDHADHGWQGQVEAPAKGAAAPEQGPANAHGHDHHEGADDGHHAHDDGQAHDDGDDHDHDHDHNHNHNHNHNHDHDHDHDHGHDHAPGSLDPHAWLDPANAEAWLGLIAEALAAHDPEHAALYRANAEAARKALVTLEARIAADLAPHAAKPFLVAHEAYGYFTGHFGLRQAAAIADGDAAAPGAQRLRALRAELAAAGVVCAFPEVGRDEGQLRMVTEGSGIRLGAPLDPEGRGHTPGPGLYAALLAGMAEAMSDCLGAAE